MKQIFLTPEMAKRWYNGTDAELKELAYQTYPELFEKQLPKSWGELKKIPGFYVDTDCIIREIGNSYSVKDNRNIFATQEQAEASIALAQLSQLMKVYNGDWAADWDWDSEKFVIIVRGEKLFKIRSTDDRRFLAFKDAKTRDLFLDNFRELILKAKPLL